MGSKITKVRTIKNPLESITDFGDSSGIVKGVGKSLVDDLGKGGVDDFMEMFGLGKSSTSDSHSARETQQSESEHGFLAQGEIVNFKKKIERTEKHIEAAIDYHRDIVRSSEQVSTKEMQGFKNQIQQIKAELVSLANSTKVLQMEFAGVSVEQTPENVGVYHTNFFEWMLGMLRAARERVETSEAWMSAQKGKAGKKGYWGMFKKHGTSFGLSNERAVATQVG